MHGRYMREVSAPSAVAFALRARSADEEEAAELTCESARRERVVIGSPLILIFTILDPDDTLGAHARGRDHK